MQCNGARTHCLCVCTSGAYTVCAQADAHTLQVRICGEMSPSPAPFSMLVVAASNSSIFHSNPQAFRLPDLNLHMHQVPARSQIHYLAPGTLPCIHHSASGSYFTVCSDTCATPIATHSRSCWMNEVVVGGETVLRLWAAALLASSNLRRYPTSALVTRRSYGAQF